MARIALVLSNLSTSDVVGPTFTEYSRATWENDEWPTFVETLESYMKKQKLNLVSFSFLIGDHYKWMSNLKRKINFKANVAVPTSGGRMQAVDDLKWDDVSSQ